MTERERVCVCVRVEVKIKRKSRLGSISDTTIERSSLESEGRAKRGGKLWCEVGNESACSNWTNRRSRSSERERCRSTYLCVGWVWDRFLCCQQKTDIRSFIVALDRNNGSGSRCALDIKNFFCARDYFFFFFFFL